MDISLNDSVLYKYGQFKIKTVFQQILVPKHRITPSYSIEFAEIVWVWN